MPRPFPGAAIPVILPLLVCPETIRTNEYPVLSFLYLYSIRNCSFILAGMTNLCFHRHIKLFPGGLVAIRANEPII